MSISARELHDWILAAGIEVRVHGEAVELSDEKVASLVFDSREVDADTVFCAVAGESTHGIHHLDAAFAAGAAFALVEGEVPVDVPGLVLGVDDARTALTAAASAWLEREAPRVIGITGSNGKTTTKDLTTAALRGSIRVAKSPGNRNSGWGLPAAILGFEGGEDVAVLEMGASAPDEIGRLARMARPWMGCITNVAGAHLEFFGSLDEVARTKGQLVEALPDDGVAVLNVDDPRFASLRARSGAQRCVGFGKADNADIQITAVKQERDGLRLRLDGIDLRLPLFGEANAYNAAAALAMARALGVSDRDSIERMQQIQLSAHRSRAHEVAGRILVDDSYNANPASVIAALHALGHMEVAGRRVAVLGDMAELGPESAEMHSAVAREALEVPCEAVVLLGTRYGTATLPEDERVTIFEDFDANEVADHLAATTAAGDALLFKASRSVALERVLDALVERLASDDRTLGGQA